MVEEAADELQKEEMEKFNDILKLFSFFWKSV